MCYRTCKTDLAMESPEIGLSCMVSLVRLSLLAPELESLVQPAPWLVPHTAKPRYRSPD